MIKRTIATLAFAFATASMPVNAVDTYTGTMVSPVHSIATRQNGFQVWVRTANPRTESLDVTLIVRIFDDSDSYGDGKTVTRHSVLQVPDCPPGTVEGCWTSDTFWFPGPGPDSGYFSGYSSHNLSLLSLEVREIAHAN